MPFSALALALVLMGQQPGERSVWTLTINEVARGDVVVVMRGSDVWLPVATLNAAGVNAAGGTAETLYGEPHVLLNSLAPAVTFRLDRDFIRLELTAAPQLFASKTFNILAPRPPGLWYPRSFSIFLNYGVHWENDVDGVAVASEFGVSTDHGVFLTGVLRAPDGRMIRGLSTLSYNQRAIRRRWVAGDTFGAPTELGSRPVVLGLSVSKENWLDPYYQANARPTLAGSAMFPSQADVYVNGQLVQRLTIPPGPFRVDRLPVTTGLGNAQIVVRDPFGREQTFQTSYYLAQATLRRGEQDYTYAAGARRIDHSDGQTEYGGAAATALHRIGVTNFLTLGYQAEGESGLAAAGPVVDLKLWRAGEFGWTGMVSQHRGVTGYAFNVNYFFNSRLLSAFANASYYDSAFTSIDRPLSQGADWYGRFEIGVPLGSRVHVGAGAFRDRAQDQFLGPSAAPPLPLFGPSLTASEFSFLAANRITAFDAVPVGRQGLSFTGSYSMNRRVQITASGRLLKGDTLTESRFEGFAGVIVLFGRSTGQVLYSHTGDQPGVSVSLTRSLPLGPGFGYRLDTDTSSDTDIAEIQGQTTRGYGAFRYQRSGNHDAVAADYSGGLAFMGNRLTLSRALNASYALVRVPGASDVHVFSNNQPVGKTNGSGDLLITDLFPYVENRLSIRDSDLPLNYAIQTSTVTMAPPYRGGAVILFRATQIRVFQGRVVIADGPNRINPAYGTMTVTLNGTASQSPLSADGDFYFENLTAGMYHVTVESDLASCRFNLQVPNATSLITSLGTIECQSRRP